MIAIDCHVIDKLVLKSVEESDIDLAHVWVETGDLFHVSLSIYPA